MNIRKVECKTFVTYLHCTNCDGEMEKTNSTLLTHPPQYHYVCKSCGGTTTSDISYPQITYEHE